MRDKHEMEMILSGIQADKHVQEMKNYIQHGRISTFEHCENVAKLSYAIDELLSLRSDLKVLITGAMLHDFFLYDWHEKGDGNHPLHGFSHAEKAAENASKYFAIDEKTRQVIYCHMWPLNLVRVPKSREAWIVCFADKWVSIKETLFRRNG
jgi:uncharacterized protein